MRDLSRLRELAEVVLPAVREEEFNLNIWSDGCGTAACAVGYACEYTPFQEEGLKIVYSGVLSNLIPQYKGRVGFVATERFFNLSKEEAYYLFDADEYLPEEKSVKSVIKRIKNFLDNSTTIRSSLSIRQQLALL